jgi:hypothetical protein
LSRAFSQPNDSGSLQIGDQVRTPPHGVLRDRRKRPNHSGQSTPRSVSVHRPIYRIGGSAIRDSHAEGSTTPVGLDNVRPSTPRAVAAERTIRFPDDEPARVASDKSS